MDLNYGGCVGIGVYGCVAWVREGKEISAGESGDPLFLGLSRGGGCGSGVEKEGCVGICYSVC